MRHERDNVAELAAALAEIPDRAWAALLRREPEWREMESVARAYPPGLFLCAMFICGLNDYHLRGRADEVYWPRIARALLSSPVPESLPALEAILSGFFAREKDAEEKLDALRVFLRSALAGELCGAGPAAVALRLGSLQERLGETLGSPRASRMAPLAFKCLAIGLLLLGVERLEPTPWPVPLDPRTRAWTPRLESDAIREFWDRVLARLRSAVPGVTLLHLDSLLWQLARIPPADRAGYLASLGVPEPAAGRVVEALTQARSGDA